MDILDICIDFSSNSHENKLQFKTLGYLGSDYEEQKPEI
jgi:hypothetical protein